MYLSAYHFDGDPDQLLAGYQRLMAGLPPESIELHLCAAGERGITVLDGCPSREVFTEFSTGPEFRAALAEAGLPTPRIEPLGDVHALRVRQEVSR